MKKNFLISAALFCLLLHCYPQEDSAELINMQTETMLQEVRQRNGIDDKFETAAKEEKPKKDFFANGRTKFATGIELTAAVSNSYFLLKDFLQPELEIDFTKMSDNSPKSGFSTSEGGGLRLFLAIYAKDKYEFGSHTGTKGLSLINLPKNLIDFAGKGTPKDGKASGEITNMTYVFADTSLFFGMKIKKFKFKITASYFVSLFHFNYSLGTYEFVNDSITGKLLAKGKFNLSIYSDLPIFTNSRGINISDINTIFKNGGFDMSLDGAYEFNSIARLNFSLQAIPIFPARVKKGTSAKFEGEFEIESIVDSLTGSLLPQNGPKNFYKMEYVLPEISYDLQPKKILRPLKLHVSADIYPFQNNYLIITPNIGCHCLRPFYIDAGLRLESRFLKVLGAYYSFNREDKVWKNKAGFFIDTRLLRLEAAAAMASPSFTGSFKAKGTELYIGLVAGY